MKVRMPRINHRDCYNLVATIQDALFLKSGPSGVFEDELDAHRASAVSGDYDIPTSRLEYLRAECFRKFRIPGDADKLSTSAIQKFWQAEAQCFETNARLDGWRWRHSVPTRVLERARSIISNLLGRFDWEEFPESCRFGPGASTSIRAAHASHQTKWQCSEHITATAVPYWLAFRKWANLPDIPSFTSVVEGNRVTTVPKNWKTDRIIAIEPDWNCFFQLGVGKMLRRRLQRVGLLTRDAQEVNDLMALEGSSTGSLATIDLSAASDTVSLELCHVLLPPDWLRVILDLRSPVGVLPDGTRVTYDKVSSMGNGFTFELETLIFWALTSSVCGRRNASSVRAYGDDIICPADKAEEVVAALQGCGFSVNLEKTFLTGPFRESCGGHYLDGHDVTPFYVQEVPATLGEVIDLANRVAAWCYRAGYTAWGPFWGFRQLVLAMVPRSFRGPWGTAGSLWCAWDTATPKYNRLDPVNGFWSVHSCERSRKVHQVFDAPGALLTKLWYVDEELQASKLPRALRKERVRQAWIPSRQWYYPLVA